MERPKPEFQQIKRTVTGEIVYLDAMRQRGERPQDFSELTDDVRRAYEAEATELSTRGLRPEIMDVYELCDAELTPLEASCRALIRELVSHNENPSGRTFEHIHTDVPPEEVLAALQSIQAGSLFADDDEQLARGPSEYYGMHDIRKCDSQLIDARVTVWQWNAPGITRDPTVPKDQYGDRSVLYFPMGESQEWGQLDVTLWYVHPQEGEWSETLSLHQGIDGDVSLGGSTWLSVYAETGYEGDGNGKGRRTDPQAVTEFAELVAELVGDEPMSEPEHLRRQFAVYLQDLKVPESDMYLREWADNEWAGQVLHELHTVQVGPVSLHDALVTDTYATEAHAHLVELVDARRSSRNLSAVSQTAEMNAFLGELEHWHDLVER